jgi:hypothetical protein
LGNRQGGNNLATAGGNPGRARDAFRRTSLACLALSALLWLPAAGAESEDARFADGLRQRRLFSLAESFCRDRLADDRLGDADRADLVIQLMRCYAAQAVQASPADREPLWQAARQAAADFERDHAASPRQILVRVQDALTVAARGELLRLEAELLPDSGRSLDDAKSAFREAGRLLEQRDEELTLEIPQRHRQSPRAEDLSADELTNLQHHVRYQRSRVQLGLALCYPPDSDDRIAMLAQAVDALRQPLTQLAAGDPLADRLRTQLAGCYRLLGNFAAAEQTLREVRPSAGQADAVLEVRAEAARLELARGRPRQALDMLGQGREVGGRVSPELDFAHLETYLALWRDAHERGDASEAENWQIKAVAMVKLVEQTHGPAWGRRSDLLLVHSIGGVRGGADLEVLVRTGDNLYRKGQADEAIATYEKAATAAAAAGQIGPSFQLRYKAALVDQNRQRYGRASEKLRALGGDLRTEPKAAEAHLLAAWNAAQEARQNEAALDAYEKILSEHLAYWPRGDTADTARLWLGRLRELQQQWADAAEAYQGIDGESEQAGEALPAAVRCWEKQLNDLRAAKKSTESTALAAAGRLAARVERLVADASQPWTGQDRLCAEWAARFLVKYASRGGPQAESLLVAALSGQPPPEPAWRATAQSLLVLALAAQDGKQAEAERVLRQLGSLPAADVAEVIANLSALAESASSAGQREIAALRLAALEVLGGRKSQLDAAVQSRLERWHAESLALAGRHADAVEAYGTLAARHPDDARLQAAYAELLLSDDDPKSWTMALDHWRRIAARARPQTELWYRAKFSTALALKQLGKKPEAAGRIRYLQAATPAVEATPWGRKFADLLRDCQ